MLYVQFLYQWTYFPVRLWIKSATDEVIERPPQFGRGGSFNGHGWGPPKHKGKHIHCSADALLEPCWQSLHLESWRSGSGRVDTMMTTQHKREYYHCIAGRKLLCASNSFIGHSNYPRGCWMRMSKWGKHYRPHAITCVVLLCSLFLAASRNL